MTISAIIVLFAVIWFLCLFIILPIGLRTQADDGEIVSGTHASAPANVNMKQKCIWTTLVTIPIWGLACTTIIMGWISVDTLDIYNGIKPN